MTVRWEEIEALSRRTSGGFPVVSCYLDVDAGKAPGREYLVVLKDMIRAREDDAKRMDLPREVRGSLDEDLRKIRDWVEVRFDRKGARGLAVFSSSGAGLFERYTLPCPVGNRMVVDHTPYIRPLAALREEHPRWGIALVDRESARILELDLGAIEEIATIRSEVPKQVRAAGWRGYEEGRITRHIEDKLHRHLRDTAERTHYLAKARQHDGILLGGPSEVVAEFERFLPASLLPRIVGKMAVELRSSLDEIRDRASKVESAHSRARREKAVADILTVARKGGHAVIGMEPTLDMIHRGAIATLVVGDSLTASGFRCEECGRLSSVGGPCPSCRAEALRAIPHLVDEAIEETLGQGGLVYHVPVPDEFERLGSIGGFLRFQPA